ncbi:MAG: immunity protein YezG family protein [Lysinibacillus sp.]
MVTKGMERIYQEVADILVAMIPENWRSIFLYAEIGGDYRQVFFYYYPKWREAPVYSLDMKGEFGLDEVGMDALEVELCNAFGRLHDEFTSAGQEPWTNLTFMLDEEGKMKVKFEHGEVSRQNFTERKVKWEAEYLQGAV